MAYFSNGSEGMCFDEQCAKCRYAEHRCPIAFVQMMYNYDAVNNKVATEILGHLVKDDGTCTMFEMMEKVQPVVTLPQPLFPELIPPIKNVEY